MPKQPQIDNVRNIAKRAREIGKEHDLRLIHFGVTPALDDDGENDKVVVAFEFDPNGVTKPEVVVMQADEGMRDAMEEVRKEDMERRAAAARENLKDLEERLGRDGGFL